MAVRMTGMISGLDTESLIQSLVEAQQLKNKKTVDKKTKLEWTQDKWKELNTKLYSLYTTELNKLTLQSSYLTKKASVSDESKVQVKAGSTAPLGSQTIEISQLASSGYLTGADLGDSVTKASTLADLGITGSATLNLTVGDKSTYIDVDETMSIATFTSKLQGAGINASYDEKNHRIFLSSKQSGLNNDFSLTASSANGTDILKKTGLATGQISEADQLTYDTWASNAVYSGGSIDHAATVAAIKANSATATAIDDEVKKRVATYTSNKESLEKQNVELAEKNTSLQETIDKNNTTISDIKATESYKEIFVQGSGYYETDLETAKKGLESEIESLKAAKDTGTITDEQYEERVQKKETQKSQLEQIISLEAQNKTNNESVANNGQTITTNTITITDYETKLANDNAGVISEVEQELVAKADYAKQVVNSGYSMVSGSATKINGKDAEFTLNGVKFTSDSNETTVNGVTLTLQETTTSPVTFTLTNDTQTVYDTIKSFVKKYNEILKEMNELYYADSSRGYDPLSDDEKDAMTDSEIEKWETKIKDSLLRRDNTLGGIMSSMKNALLTSVEVDGKKYSLSSFGVGTSSNYLERGLLHIQGDSEDDTYASYTNKLMAALEDDPDTVMQVFSGVAKNLYKAMQDKMKKTSLSSALTFYNDVYMKNQIIAYNKQIKKDEEKLTDLEDKYYSQFSAMETALAKLQSQQNSLSSYF